jgi:hypothetical protein
LNPAGDRSAAARGPSEVTVLRPDLGAASPRLARDYFRELLRDSQPHPGLSAERERWLRGCRVEGREERLFEFEMLLRGIERYFKLHNLPIDSVARPVVTRDFAEELRDVRDALGQAIKLSRRLLDPGEDQRMLFRRYVESQLVDDRARRALLEEELEEDTPQESLFLLRQSFESLRTVVDSLLKLETVSFRVFHEVGNLALRAILQNQYFRPFRPLEFCIEFDRVKSVPILDALRRLGDPERRLFTTAFLGLFRLLHYLAYVRPAPKGVERRSRVVLSLVRSESLTLVGYLKTEVAARSGLRRHQGAALRVARDLGRHAEAAGKRLRHEGTDSAAVLEVAKEYAEEVRHLVLRLAVAVDARPGVEEMTFGRLASAVTMAQRLRNDLWVFARLSRATEDVLTRPQDDAGPALSALWSFLGYFQDVAYQLLRYGDLAPVDQFAAILRELEHVPTGPGARNRLAEDCREFAEAADACFVAVGRRSDVAGRRFDESHARAVLERFQGS